MKEGLAISAADIAVANDDSSDEKASSYSLDALVSRRGHQKALTSRDSSKDAHVDGHASPEFFDASQNSEAHCPWPQTQGRGVHGWELIHSFPKRLYKDAGHASPVLSQGLPENDASRSLNTSARLKTFNSQDNANTCNSYDKTAKRLDNELCKDAGHASPALYESDAESARLKKLNSQDVVNTCNSYDRTAHHNVLDFGKPTAAIDPVGFSATVPGMDALVPLAHSARLLGPSPHMGPGPKPYATVPWIVGSPNI
eukprot:7898546-Karenia_brevis.AAC.1